MDTRRTARTRTATLLFVVVSLGAVVAQDASKPYSETPPELVPYRGAGKPYHTFFVEPPTFRGPGRDAPEPTDVEEVRIGVLAPLAGPDAPLGRNLQNGVELAFEEANAAGGYRDGVPFVALVRDEAQAWGAAANAAVELATRHGVWGLIGGVEDANSHVLTRVLLKLEVPLVNTAGPDPTLTEHAIPWIVRTRPDDRRNCYRLARKVFEEDGRSRVAVFRSNDRYGRMGVAEFVDAARRLHHPILLEVRFEDRDDDWDARLERIRQARPDAIVVWGRAAAAGRALRALRAAGLDQPVYGPDRLKDARFLAAAGPAAEGTVFTYPFDPDSERDAWTTFRERYRTRFGEEPDAIAAGAYDGATYLVQAVREAGLNRVRIRDQLFAHASFEGVAGKVRFDPSHNNVAQVVLGRVAAGRFRFD